MIIDNATGNDFKPDPLLDEDRDFDARILGVAFIGKHDKQKHDGTNFIDEYDQIDQAVVAFELTEEDTFVTRGAEGSEKQVPRVMVKFLKYSSHEKSAMFELAKAANSQAAFIEEGKGKVRTDMMITQPVAVKLKTNKEGTKQNIHKIAAYPTKHKASVDPLQGKPFQYHIDGGAFPLEDGTVTTIEDVPAWILRLAIDKAINAEQFGQLEVIEAYLEAEDKKKKKPEDTELEGDRLPAKTEEKSEPAKVEEKSEDKPSGSRRSRRAKKAEEKDEFADMTLEQIEDLFLEKGGEESVLDDIGEKTEDDDEAYKAGIIAAIKSL